MRLQASGLPLFKTSHFTPAFDPVKSPLNASNSGIEYYLSDPSGALSHHQDMCDPDRLQVVVEVWSLDCSCNALMIVIMMRMMAIYRYKQ
jgi:hypothetical protein